MKRATTSQPKVNLELSELQVTEAETLNDHKELGEGNEGEHDEGAEATTQDESPQENEAAAAAAADEQLLLQLAFLIPTMLMTRHLKVIMEVTSFETPFWQKIMFSLWCFNKSFLGTLKLFEVHAIVLLYK